MNDPESDRDLPRPAWPRPSRALAAAAIPIIVAMAAGGVGCAALILGWHPIPATALGCSLHKRFHSYSFSPVTNSENLGLATDCLDVTMRARQETYVYLTEDWLGFSPGKRYQRPICRDEWRQMAAIIASGP